MNNNLKKLSAYIDSLNNEKKPDINTDSEELNELYAAVRQVKSLKQPVMPDKDFERRLIQNLTRNKQQIKNKKKTWIGGLASIAAILVLALLINFTSLITPSNLVYAMEQAYNNVMAYHGTLEVIFCNEAGENQTQSVLDVWVDKKGNYYINVLEGSYKGLKTVSDGEKVWQSSSDENIMNVLPVFSDTYEFLFDLGNEIDELKNAESTRIVGNDNIAGRPAYVMEVTPKGGLPYKLWVDREIKIPLQKEGAMNKAIQYTTRYTEINFAESIPEELIAIDPNEGFEEVGINENIKDTNENAVENDNTGRFTPEITVNVDLDVEKAEQRSADSGSSPWKLDPVYVAQVFVSLQLSPEGIAGDYPVDYDDFSIAENHGNSVKIDVNSEKTNIKTVYLERLIRQDDTGIWTVTGYDISR